MGLSCHLTFLLQVPAVELQEKLLYAAVFRRLMGKGVTQATSTLICFRFKTISVHMGVQ